MSAGEARAGTALLSFRAVGKIFVGGVKAIESVSFDVQPGEFCVLLGRSGAGKSTLLRAVNGLTDLTSGEMQFRGEPISKANLRATRRRVAMIHQQFGLVPRATVASNVLSGALAAQPLWRSALGWYPPAQRAKCWQLVRRVGLGAEQLFRRAQDLSGGQQQRVGIARAFMLDPELILADEPVASLDPNVSREVLQLLQGAARERGAAVLCSLHQLDLAREFGDHIVGVHGGRVIFDGSGADLSPEMVARIYAGPRDAAEIAPAGLATNPLPQQMTLARGLS